MSQKKCKLVLKAVEVYEGTELVPSFKIAKSVNTLEFGVPGDELSRKVVDRILIDKAAQIQRNLLVVEFIT